MSIPSAPCHGSPLLARRSPLFFPLSVLSCHHRALRIEVAGADERAAALVCTRLTVEESSIFRRQWNLNKRQKNKNSDRKQGKPVLPRPWLSSLKVWVEIVASPMGRGMTNDCLCHPLHPLPAALPLTQKKKTHKFWARERVFFFFQLMCHLKAPVFIPSKKD